MRALRPDGKDALRTDRHGVDAGALSRRGTERATGARMDLIYMLLVGLIVGALAKLVMPGRDPGGIIITMLLGVAGSMLAGFIGREMHWYAHDQAAGLIASICGAMLLLFGYRVFARRRAA
jgi:uncharacterized membrane protein YeaQ/YmgE (transglycosylase-associated protein family)